MNLKQSIDFILPKDLKPGYQKFYTQPLLENRIVNFAIGQKFSFFDSLTQFSQVHQYYMAFSSNTDFDCNDIINLNFKIFVFPIIALYDQINQVYTFKHSINPSKNFSRFPFSNWLSYDENFKADEIYYVYLFSYPATQPYFNECSLYKFYIEYSSNSGNPNFIFNIENIYRIII